MIKPSGRRSGLPLGRRSSKGVGDVTKKVSVIERRRTAASQDSSASYVARRKEICDAAIRVFHRQGFAGASLSGVAAELGIDRASLYYYFASKDELFDEITTSVLDENAKRARRIADSAVSPRRKLRELITAMMISYGENYPLLYIYIREDLRQVADSRSQWSAHMRELNRQIESAFIEIIEQGYEDQSLRRIGSAKIVAYGILGMLNWSHRWYQPDRGDSPDDAGRTFAELALSGLESPF